MTRNELRSLVLEWLGRPKPPHHLDGDMTVRQLHRDLAETARTRGLRTLCGNYPAALRDGDVHELHPGLHAPVWDVLWELVLEAVIRPGEDGLGRNGFPHLHVTEFGREVLKGRVDPHDPDGYLKALRARVPALDDTILAYLAESAKTLRSGCLLASTVMMGCASEQAMLLLIGKTADACDPARRQAFEAAVRKPRAAIKQQNEEYRRWFENTLRARLKKEVGPDWTGELENALSLLFNYFRTMRNDAGHPTRARVSREEATAHLVLFPRYLELLYEFMAWLDANKPI